MLAQFKEDYTKLELDHKSRLALDFSVKLTRQAWTTRQEDIDRLRNIGYTDEEIIEIVHIASYFNYINRVLDGLGGEVEEEMKERKK